MRTEALRLVFRTSAVVVATTCVLTIVGYSFGLRRLFNPLKYYPKAMNAAVIAVTLAAGLSFRLRGQ